MASVTVTPAQTGVGKPVVISGAGFIADSVVLVEIPEYGLETEIVADAAGGFSSDDLPDRAIATLTSTGTNPAEDEVVTLGAVVYRFKASGNLAQANDVLIGASAAATLLNLKNAVNHTGTPGTDYHSATVIHPTVTAAAATTTTLRFYAKTAGTGGNALVSTETSTTFSFGGTTFAGGAASTGVSSLIFTPTDPRPFTVKASDGTNSAQARVMVWTS